MVGSEHRKQAGDTIIEVLIAVMVVGLAITISYAIANRSLRISRRAQERSEATKLAAGQIEQLKALAQSDNNKGIFDNNGVFCITDSGDPTAPGAFASYGTAIKSTDTTLQGYPPECVKGVYHLAIQETADNQFDVVTRWISYGSDKVEQVRMTYRLYP